jgi:hypothetical protein
MKKIPIYKKHGVGGYALVDDEDYDDLMKFRWGMTTQGYAFRAVMINHKARRYRMHREVMNAPRFSWSCQVDHIDGNKLNNQKSNLRFCTASQNRCNIGKKKGYNTIYKGVRRARQRSGYTARITIKYKAIDLGTYDTPELAYAAYCGAAKAVHGDFANVG